MTRQFHHFALVTTNMERALRFFLDALGFQIVEEYRWTEGNSLLARVSGLSEASGRAVMLKLGGAFLEIIQFELSPSAAVFGTSGEWNNSPVHLCFEVADVEAECARLAASGFPPICPPQDSGSGTCLAFVRDPDGRLVELVEFTNPDDVLRLE